MITLAKLKQSLEFNKSLGTIIDILKTTALVQFRSFQFKEKPNPEFSKEIEDVFEIFGAKNIRHPYFFERLSLPSAIIIITSDEGFLGGLNTLLINAALDSRRSKNDELVVLGERGAGYLEDLKESFVPFPGISDEAGWKEPERVADYVLGGYKKKFGGIFVSYPKFVSLTHQKVEVLQLLPRLPDTGPADGSRRDREEVTMEPARHRVVEAAVELWVRYKLFEIFWLSKQSEYAARIMHLEGSTYELSGLSQRLRFDYFRRVHALSDKTIREISAAKLLLNKMRS
ncbi:MAG: F0F1 ATP synthase subunit gamma [Candidatus Omnitrophica bacterium]|nr:F0F1 ATP synthase subunit gamma [Candidatus Omnitrophota bacterium]